MPDNPLPKTSIIVRCYNQASFIAQALKSAMDQDYPNLEIIVVDDCSEDNSRDVIKKMTAGDKRVRLFFHERNLGQKYGNAAVLNAAMKLATGKYLANLDGDDYWLSSEKISRQVAWLEKNPDHVLVGCFVQNVDKNGRLLDKYELAMSDRSIRNKILRQNQLSASGVLYRLQPALRSGGYPSETMTAADFGLWLLLGLLGKLANLPYYWHAHRMTGQNIGETQRQQQLEDSLFYAYKFRRFYPNYALSWLKLYFKKLAFSLPVWAINLIRRTIGSPHIL